jgi:hypothetical protein
VALVGNTLFVANSGDTYAPPFAALLGFTGADALTLGQTPSILSDPVESRLVFAIDLEYAGGALFVAERNTFARGGNIHVFRNAVTIQSDQAADLVLPGLSDIVEPVSMTTVER